MDELAQTYTNRVRRLSQLLREYEGMLNNWMKINLVIFDKENSYDPNDPIPTVRVEFYKYIVKPGYNGKPTAFRNSTDRQFPFTIEELDKAIDRYRQKITYEKKKLEKEEQP